MSGVATRAAFFSVIKNRHQDLRYQEDLPGLGAVENTRRPAGAVNHRMGLYDMAMIKDNHVALVGAAGKLAGRIAAMRKAKPGQMK